MNWRRILSRVREHTFPAREREIVLLEDAARAERVARLLEDADLQEYWARQEEQLVDRLVSLPPEDDQGRYRLAVAIQSIRQTQEYLRKSAEHGRVAQAELERLERGPRRAFF